MEPKQISECTDQELEVAAKEIQEQLRFMQLQANLAAVQSEIAKRKSKVEDPA